MDRLAITDTLLLILGGGGRRVLVTVAHASDSSVRLDTVLLMKKMG